MSRRRASARLRRGDEFQEADDFDEQVDVGANKSSSTAPKTAASAGVSQRGVKRNRSATSDYLGDVEDSLPKRSRTAASRKAADAGLDRLQLNHRKVVRIFVVYDGPDRGVYTNYNEARRALSSSSTNDRLYEYMTVGAAERAFNEMEAEAAKTSLRYKKMTTEHLRPLRVALYNLRPRYDLNCVYYQVWPDRSDDFKDPTYRLMVNNQDVLVDFVTYSPDGQSKVVPPPAHNYPSSMPGLTDQRSKAGIPRLSLLQSSDRRANFDEDDSFSSQDEVPLVKSKASARSVVYETPSISGSDDESAGGADVLGENLPPRPQRIVNRLRSSVMSTRDGAFMDALIDKLCERKLLSSATPSAAPATQDVGDPQSTHDKATSQSKARHVPTIDDDGADDDEVVDYLAPAVVVQPKVGTTTTATTSVATSGTGRALDASTDQVSGRKRDDEALSNDANEAAPSTPRSSSTEAVVASPRAKSKRKAKTASRYGGQ